MDILQQADREIDAAGDASIGFLMPEDQWEAFVAETRATPEGDPPEIIYRGIRFKRAAVTAIVHEEGF